MIQLLGWLVAIGLVISLVKTFWWVLVIGGIAFIAWAFYSSRGTGEYQKNEAPGLKNFVAIDVETTGLDPARNHIIEIAAIKYINGKEVDKFVTLVKPPVKIPKKITEINGIDDEMVKDAPGIDEVIPKFKELIKDMILVAHNMDFDSSFVEHAAGPLNNVKVCTLRSSREVFEDMKSHKLIDVARKIGFVGNGYHRAEFDARAAGEIYKYTHMIN